MASKIHIDRSHKMNQLLDCYVCDYCSRTFTRKYNLQTHIENCHLNSTCYCEICDQRFGSPAGLQLHLSRGHNRYGQPYPECDICGRIFTRKQNINSHMITVHLHGVGPEIRCEYCFKTFSAERNLKRHTNQLHNPAVNYATCDECHKVFKGKRSLISHLQSAHANDRPPIMCHMCNKIYSNNRSLKRHIEMFHGEKSEFKCDLCPKVYTSNQSLRRHYRTNHSTENAGQYRCEYCSELVLSKDFLWHLQVCNHQDRNNLIEDDRKKIRSVKNVCDTCDLSFEEEPHLRQHIKMKHSFQTFYDYCKKSLVKQIEKNKIEVDSKSNAVYNCEYCRNYFISVYELKDHMRVNHDREYSLSTCNVCFTKFYSKETMYEHKKVCLPPSNVNSCNHCDKLFTDLSSLEFHTRIFHPQAQIADPDVTSTNPDDNPIECGSYRCVHCDRVYYSDRSLKHHIKLKHTTDEAMECELCGKICSNKYYLASHTKMVHNNDTWSKCNYCDKEFKTKRNIRRHIEYTHLGMQRHKCIECETLFKEKRSLRKHVRTKHPNSAMFPQCHICYKRFESAKSCKTHLKLLHSFNMNTYPCGLCSVSFSSYEALSIHLQTKHLPEDEIYKCEECNLVFYGHEKFEQHNEMCHVSSMSKVRQKILPRCIICMKDFSTRKTLKRHIKKFHDVFDVDELASFGSIKRVFNVECADCLKSFKDEFNFNVYQKLKHLRDSIVFECDRCGASYTNLEYAIQKYRTNNSDMSQTKLIMSELCTTEMSDGEASEFKIKCEVVEPESTTTDIKVEVLDESDVDYIKSENISPEYNVKTEPVSH